MKRSLDECITYCINQISDNLEGFRDKFPSAQSKKYIYSKNDCTDWVEGFWPGILWIAFELTSDDKFKEVALNLNKYFKKRVDQNINVDTHDLGFLYSLSCVASYKLIKDEEAKKTALKAAALLAKRYHEKGEFIQAWGSLNSEDNYRLIIDCLLNIPLLFWASEEGDNPKYREIAIKHLKTTANVIIRENGSTFHTFFFNPETGEKLRGETNQGFSDSSCWARGQSWAIYGFALAYKYTKDESLIAPWKKVTKYFISHLPPSFIPYWDLDFVDGKEPRDSSAAAIAICGILEMNKYLEEKIYLDVAFSMFDELKNNYLTNEYPLSNGLLIKGMYGRPRGDKSECNIWGDYFFMEAIIRLKKDWNLYW